MNRRTCQGFTLIETLLGVAFASLLVGSVVRLVTTTDTLSRDTRIQNRASAEHAEAHEALRRLFANADLDTLGGFDVAGTATHPTWQRVTGVVDGALVHAAAEALVWKADTHAVSGVSQAGHVEHTEPDGTVRTLFGNVPAGGFSLRLEGRNLVVHLTTFHGPNTAGRVFLTSDAVLSLRN
jgi:type II secretory pathway pseudopilin PulG